MNLIRQLIGSSRSRLLVLIVSSLFIATFPLSFQFVSAEDVTFIVPGSKDPNAERFFDPELQIIEKGQSIVFVNPDREQHRLLVKPVGEDLPQQGFDTGEMKPNQFVSHTFSENGRYTIECTIYPHMKGEILVTEDIATFTQTIPEQNLDVQLSRSPATPQVGEETYFKVLFINKDTGRNHQHIDYVLQFEDSQGEYFDGQGGHTVDGAEYGSYTFDKEEIFTPKVEVSGIDFIPITPVTVQFDTIVTPEFPPVAIGAIMATVIGAIALYRRKYR